MINKFEKETQSLSDYEKDILLPSLIIELKAHVGKDKAITNKEIVNSLKLNFKISEARVRKIINHIRINDFIPALIATSGGYYIAQTDSELRDYENSLKGREEAIRNVRVSIARQRNKLEDERLDGQQ